MLQDVHHVHDVVHNRDALVDDLEHTFGMTPDHLVVYDDRGMKDAL
jgi:N-acetylglucosamine kinase-like BadF-type ATPase